MVVLDETPFVDQKNLSDLEALAGLPNPSKGTAVVDSDGEAFAMAYSDEQNQDAAVHAATYPLVGSKLTLSEAFVLLADTANHDRNPAIVSLAGAGATSRRSMIVWDNQPAFSGDPPSDIHGALYESTLYSSYCHPGYDTVGACPCGNPPSAYGRGCNNSQSTGGAKLSLSGNWMLSWDTLVLSGAQVKSNAISVFNQGSAALASSVTFGQGLRCVGGVITSGTTRSYYIYYRDPVVLGGCPSASTFNTTQAVQAIWVP